MLEVTARVDRDVAIYLAGETIRVFVTVTNRLGKAKSPPASDELAWGSVQFICERSVGAKSNGSASQQRPTTAMMRPASTVYSSSPIIIFCELRLGPGQTREFECEIPLSRDSIPPSFRGFHVKYSNRVTIAVSHVQAHIRSTNLPIRIIPSVGLEEKLSLPDNPFLAANRARPSIVETVMGTIEDLTLARKSLVFALTHASSRVALLTLPKKAYKLGDDVCGFLDFEGSSTPCAQYSVSIETDEILLDSEESERKRKTVKVHAQTAPICTFTSNSIFRLNIPLTATPSFSTDTVQLKWRIRFVFVVTSYPYDVRIQDGIATSVAPIDVPVESFSWSTDLLVLPCKPQNAALLDQAFPNKISMMV